MANLIIICGPQAVGKMTVAENLRDKLKYNMMMNHDSIEVSDKIFGFGTPAQKEFNAAFREKAFELAVKHDVDLIFTYVCAFEMPQERSYLSGVADLFTANGGNFYFAELSASLEARLERNETPHRMERKASKRDIAWSKSNLLRDIERHRLNSNDGEIWFQNHIKIDNTSLRLATFAKGDLSSPFPEVSTKDEVADMIIEKFGLVANEKEEKEYRFGV